MNKKIKKTFAKQLDQSDCGVACLAAIIRYHEGDTSIEKLREASGTTHQGTTLLGLYQAASNNGFNADALYAKSIENLKELQEPAILHVLTTNGLSHYVVFYGFDRDKIIIGDPANGVSFYTHEQLEKIWIKKALLKLIPKDDFVKRSVIQGYKLKWIYTLIEEDKVSIQSGDKILVANLGHEDWRNATGLCTASPRSSLACGLSASIPVPLRLCEKYCHATDCNQSHKFSVKIFLKEKGYSGKILTLTGITIMK